jgi:hypothetical protein
MKKIVVGMLISLAACNADVGNSADSNDDNSSSVVSVGSNSSDKDSCDVRFLWKPESESDGKLVVLFEKGVYFNEVWAENLLGGYDPANYVGLTNGGRATYRFSEKGSEYTGLLVADDCEFRIEEPSEREE